MKLSRALHKPSIFGRKAGASFGRLKPKSSFSWLAKMMTACLP